MTRIKVLKRLYVTYKRPLCRRDYNNHRHLKRKIAGRCQIINIENNTKKNESKIQPEIVSRKQYITTKPNN